LIGLLLVLVGTDLPEIIALLVKDYRVNKKEVAVIGACETMFNLFIETSI
jgi:hypothetical protein